MEKATEELIHCYTVIRNELGLFNEALLHQPELVVINKAGAGGAIAAESVAHAPADGYTLIFVNSAHEILKFLNKNLPFDPVRDFAGVAIVGTAPAILVVPPSLGVTDLKEFIALAKANPGQLNYGSAGIGTSTHLAGAYFAAQTADRKSGDVDLLEAFIHGASTIGDDQRIADLLDQAARGRPVETQHDTLLVERATQRRKIRCGHLDLGLLPRHPMQKATTVISSVCVLVP